MNEKFTSYSENEMYHYGVLGMKWGVRKGRSKGRSSTSRSQKKRISAKRTLSRAGRIAIQSAAMTAVLTGSLAAVSQSRMTAASSFVDSYLAKNGNRKISSVKKEVDRSDWTWADYAWAEVEK